MELINNTEFEKRIHFIDYKKLKTLPWYRLEYYRRNTQQIFWINDLIINNNSLYDWSNKSYWKENEIDERGI